MLDLDQLKSEIHQTCFKYDQVKPYFDRFLLSAQPHLLLHSCHQLMTQVIKSYELMKSQFSIAAMDLGGVPVGTVLSMLMNVPLILVRKDPNLTNGQHFIEGGDVENKDIVVIEDLITHGITVINTVTKLKEDGAKINLILTLVEDDRHFGRDNIKSSFPEVPMVSLFKLSELM